MSIPYLRQGSFPLREGGMMNFADEPENQGVLLSWGIWLGSQAANDEAPTNDPEWFDEDEAA